MKSYPHILGPSKAPHLPCLAFYKYDGSNMRFEYSRKRGWYKFGTRTQLINELDPVFGEAIPIFFETLAEGVEKVLRDRYRERESAIVFAEFFGQKSFAGTHLAGDPKELVLFDVNPYKDGILGPREFVKSFGHLKSAQVVYEGNFNDQLVDDVRNGRIEGLVEGVVCKGGSGHSLWMRKIKTNAYRERLERLYTEGWEKYWE